MSGWFPNGGSGPSRAALAQPSRNHAANIGVQGAGMKNLHLPLLAAAILAAAGPALAQPGSIDTNNDGKLSLPEFLAGRSAPMMQRFDANKDGKLTAAELQAGRPQRPA